MTCCTRLLRVGPVVHRTLAANPVLFLEARQGRPEVLERRGKYIYGAVPFGFRRE